MLKITVNETLAKIIKPPPNVVKMVDDALAFVDPSQKFVFAGGKARLRVNQKKIRLFDRQCATFPAGLLPAVCRILRSKSIPYSVTDTAVYATDTRHKTEWLRPEQKRVVDRAVLRKRGILWVPTGGGKTEIAIGLALRIDTPWLFLTHRQPLLNQTRERYTKRTGKIAGKIGDGEFDVQPFTVATFQTLAAGLRKGDKRVTSFLKSVGAICVDECHITPADTFWNVCLQCTHAAYRYGLSGTPLGSKQGKEIFTIAALGPVIVRIYPDELINAGLLARPIIRMPTLVQSSSKPTWQGVYGDCITRSAVRNDKIAEFANISEKPALVFVKEIKHGQLLEKLIRKKGIACEFLSGKQTTQQREAAVARLEKGDIDVLVVTVIFQEGVDIPTLRSVVIGSSGKSVIAAIQRVGRGMRKTKNKNVFHVYDVNDRGHRNLDGWSRGRKKAYQNEGYEVLDK